MPVNPSPRAVIFDLDGTLVDTAPDLAGAMNRVLREAGRPELPTAIVRAMVGRGARVLIEAGFRETGAGLEGADLTDQVALFLAHYRDNIVNASRPFDGSREAVDRLAQAGFRLGVCTNKPKDLADLLLQKLDFVKPFGSIRGADSAPYKKPDPRHVFDVLNDLNVPPDRAILIGDSETDVKAARNAGIPIILVSFGYTETPVHALGADAIIDSFAELESAIARWLP